jgi:hypothetical protein
MKKGEMMKGMILAGIVMLFAACNIKDDQPGLDFDITVPTSWTYYPLNNDNIVYYASSPAENQTDSITEDLLITKDAVSGMTLDQFCSAIISSLDDDTTYHKIYLSGDTSINGTDSRKLIYLQTLKLFRSDNHDTVYLHLERTGYFFVRNKYGYVVMMNALVTSYPTYKPIFENIISTFKFRN